MKKLHLYIACLLLAFWQNSHAQQLPVYNQYPFYGYLYNPAFSGIESYGSIFAAHRNQWSGIGDSPVTSLLAFDMPVQKDNMGVGAMIHLDNTHVLSRVGTTASYAYHLRFSDEADHKVSVGLAAGILNQRFNALEGNIQNLADAALFDGDLRSTTVDLSIGLNYRNNGLDVGVAVPQVVGNSLTYNPRPDPSSKFKLQQHIFAAASYRLDIGEDIMVKPVVLARYVPNLPVQADGNILVGWKGTLFLGVGYRSNGSGGSGVYGSLGVNLAGFGAHYTYESPLNSMDRGALGSSHEVSVSFRFGKEQKEIDEIMAELRKLEDLYEQTNKELEKVDSLAQVLDDVEADAQDALDAADEAKNAAKIVDAKVKDLKNQVDSLETGKTIIKNSDGSTKVVNPAMEYKKLGTVMFSKSDYSISPTAASQLKALADQLKAGNYVTIYLQGNASVEGDSEMNMILSTKRAAAVRDYLVERLMIDAEKVLLLPYGEENLSSNPQNTETERAKSRRVDIFILR